MASIYVYTSYMGLPLQNMAVFTLCAFLEFRNGTWRENTKSSAGHGTPDQHAASGQVVYVAVAVVLHV